jgi:uncharacterized membrane protein
LNLGFITLPFIEILNIIEAILILLFFFYITGRLRKKSPSSPPDEDSKRVPSRQATMPVRV